MASDRYPPLGVYGFIGDGHMAALVSMEGSVDWCCLPRMDSPACFGRLLDWDHGGHMVISPTDEEATTRRRYLPGTLVLETSFETSGGSVRLLDCMAMRVGGRLRPYRQLLRVVEGVEGEVEMVALVRPRLEYGAVRPWLRRLGDRVTAIGGSTGLLFSGDLDFEIGDGEIRARFTAQPGRRHRLSMRWYPPHVLDRPHSTGAAVPSEGRSDVGAEEGSDFPEATTPDDIDDRLDETVRWWERWTANLVDDEDLEPARRSARVLKALINPPTGAMVAAPTTSLPEEIGGERNWDYRYSWVRDSVFAVRALTALGADAEADGFRRFVERSAAGEADEVQVAYGVDGSYRLIESELELEGYRRSAPVRVGNDAYRQLQLDVFGYLLLLAWDDHQRGAEPEQAYREFIAETAHLIARRWRDPDRGIWEVRGDPHHFVHSKVMCWVGLDRAVGMADDLGFEQAAVRSWMDERDELRRTIDSDGVRDGAFVRSFDDDGVDAALLLLPLVGYVEPDDHRMVASVNRIIAELSLDGSRLIRRYVSEDGLSGEEGAFLACCFWLAEVLALQGREEDARAVFDESAAAANDLGLFSEEYDPRNGLPLGNFPQAITHLSHIDALCALKGRRRVF